MDEQTDPLQSEVFYKLKHDIKNQLSNIQLALEGLKYDIEDKEADLSIYMYTLDQSAKKIDALLNNIK